MIQGPSIYSVSEIAVASDEAISMTESCSLKSNAGLCTLDVWGWDFDRDEIQRVRVTLTTTFPMAIVTLTAGVPMLASATATYNPASGTKLGSAPTATATFTTENSLGPRDVVSSCRGFSLITLSLLLRGQRLTDVCIDFGSSDQQGSCWRLDGSHYHHWYCHDSWRSFGCCLRRITGFPFRRKMQKEQ